ncbi:MAG: hypothetical protein SPL10_03425 [Synergistales bacterium]|nr:hypothetical protein [Synergistales bacterium]MDY6402208.1 hypothetical protein [Synergistales bacterium]MDY6404156.1 hypothetical protein [Synergistales bacterium]MDY6409776.1 hypothetical protein [Synergistales bacterium]MDY6414193.1 hypothetical protein [Synergistales bacterium]
MKKFLLAFLIIIAFCSCSYGAVSDDIYVRKDLFEAEMKNINSKLDRIEKKLDTLTEAVTKLTERVIVLEERVNSLEKRIEDVNTSLSGRIDGVEARMGDLRDDVKVRIGDLNNSIYLWLIILGLLVALPFFQKWWTEHREAKRNSLTIEDVEKLFERLLLEAKSKGEI